MRNRSHRVRSHRVTKSGVTALPGVMRYKNPTPNPSPQAMRGNKGAKMYLIRAETAVNYNSRFAHLKLSYKKAEQFNQGFRL